MINNPMPVNTAAQEANSIEKTVEKILVPVAESAIQTAVPELALPVVKQIVDAIVSGVADKLTKLEELGTTFIIIDAQTWSEHHNMAEALRALIAARKSGDQNAIQKATADFQAAQSALVTDDGSATPQ